MDCAQTGGLMAAVGRDVLSGVGRESVVERDAVVEACGRGGCSSSSSTRSARCRGRGGGLGGGRGVRREVAAAERPRARRHDRVRVHQLPHRRRRHLRAPAQTFYKTGAHTL